MLKKLCTITSLFLLSIPSSAAVFTCSLQKAPPFGVTLTPDQFIKSFTFDTADVPSDKIVNYKDLQMTLHSDGKHIQMKVSNSIHESIASISSYETEIHVILDQGAEGFCLTEDATKGAVPVETTL